jgi:membrane-associated phospholipid phosphatase
MVATAATSTRVLAQALNLENQKAGAQLYGAATPGAKPSDLDVFTSAQIRRVAPPTNLQQFTAYLSELPLVKQMETDIVAGKRPDPKYYLVQWNHFALDLLSLDHTTILDDTTDDDAAFAEQVGPARSSRALAIIHVAMAEAVNFIFKKHASYKNLSQEIATRTGYNAADINEASASVPLAISWAAYDSMRALFPNKQGFLKSCLSTVLHVSIRDNETRDANVHGTKIGQAAAAATLKLRGYDPQKKVFADGSRDGEQRATPKANSFALEPLASQLFPSPAADDWQIDPLPKPPVLFALGGDWHKVDAFVLDKSAPNGLYLPPGPPAKGSPEYKKDYDEARAKGGDPNAVNHNDLRWKSDTTRTDNETFVGEFWGYDGTAFLCAPPRLYNMIATTVAYSVKPIKEVWELARYLALVNVALADAAIGAWTAKYKFHYGRPITYIRQHDKDTVILGTANEHWTPLGQVSSNASLTSKNTTPPFPAYPSGHAVFGGALFGVMRAFWGLDENDSGPAFDFVSDEYNGLNRDPDSKLRDYKPAHFASFTEAETDNAQSRIYLGIHWGADARDGITQGRKIATYVVKNSFQPN